MQRDVLTPQQVADYLQLAPETVYRLIRQNQLVATRIGRHYRIQKDEIDRFLLANSSKESVRQAAWNRVLAFAEENNPGLSSDDVLEELERFDDEQKAKRKIGLKHA